MTQKILSMRVIESQLTRDGALEKDGVLSQVNEEHLRGPMTNHLDAVQRSPSKCKSGSAASMQRVTSDIVRGEESMKFGDEPRLHRDFACLHKPKVGKVGKEGIAGF